MERMVSDPEIKKVALICDKTYVDKADGRSGGVGTETQIISPEIYRSQAQEKFVAIVKERDDEGNAYTLNIQAVDQAEIQDAKRVLRKMNFDNSFEVEDV